MFSLIDLLLLSQYIYDFTQFFQNDDKHLYGFPICGSSLEPSSLKFIIWNLPQSKFGFQLISQLITIPNYISAVLSFFSC